ncbi:hypothetical protein G5S35_23530 [Paraburkholderia tropica]|uniref:DUF6531 domain-containing protein n=1 Tax=Paraburkholderia tropica TaxID=92647 RepID=UPI001602B656|nr:DUF6531 domain-containing protein [Paraburkholderia tropica]QNB14650.1 hypothetical protein G5S35_23530 [Paraburkholderia tropica]
MFEAARVGDEIQHTNALAGFLVGAILGAALIFAVAALTFACPFVVGFVAGFLASMAAEQIVNISTQIGSMFTSVTGKITVGSANVFVNGRAAVPAQLASAACDRDTPLELAACGSSTVFVNQHVALRKGDDIQCGATVAGGSGNVLFGSEKACEIAVASEIPEWAVKFKDALFMVAGIAGGLRGALQNGMKATGPCALKYIAGQVAGIYVGGKVSEAIGGLFGNPVHVPTGQKLLMNEVDFSVPGMLPLGGSRSYSNAIDTGGMLGRGLQHNWDIHLKRSERGLEYVSFQGREVGFDDLPVGEYQYNPFEQLYLSHAFDGRYVLNGLDEIYYAFSPEPINGRHVLERIEDKFGHFIAFRRNHEGTLIEVSNDAEVVLELKHQNGRLAQVDRVDGKRRMLARYGYDDNGQLIRVRDRSYDEAQGLNESYLYDAADNLIDATRDNGASAMLDNLLSRFRETAYIYDGFGQLTRQARDGQAQDFVYDDEGRMVQASGQGSEGGYRTTYHYDALGRRIGKVTHRTGNDGSPVTEETRFVWEGMRMAQVLRGETVRTYVYSPDSPYRPMARVDQPLVTAEEGLRAGTQKTIWHHHAHDNGQVYNGARGSTPGHCGRWNAGRDPEDHLAPPRA